MAGIASSILQNAPSLVVERIRPQLSRLSISKGWKRIFGEQGQVEFLKAVFKLVAIVVLRFILLRSAQHDVPNAMFMEPGALPALILSLGHAPRLGRGGRQPSCSSPPTSSGRGCSGAAISA